VLWGTLFPILSELVQGVKITYGPANWRRKFGNDLPGDERPSGQLTAAEPEGMSRN